MVIQFSHWVRGGVWVLVLAACIMGRWWVLAPAFCGHVLCPQLVSHGCSSVLLGCGLFFSPSFVLLYCSWCQLPVFSCTRRPLDLSRMFFSSIEAMGCGVVLGAVACNTAGRFAQTAGEVALMGWRRSVGQKKQCPRSGPKHPTRAFAWRIPSDRMMGVPGPLIAGSIIRSMLRRRNGGLADGVEECRRYPPGG